MKKLWLVALVGVLLCVTRVQAAPPPDPAVQAALLHFREGAKAYNLGEFPRAVVEYKAAYHAKPDPAFLYNIAQAYRLGNDPEQAVFFYRSYLRNSPGAHPEVEEHIKRLEAQIALSKGEPAPAAGPIVDTAPVMALSPIEPPPQRTPKPAYKRGWFWGAIVGSVLVAGAAVGLGVGLTVGRNANAPGTDLGNSKVFSLSTGSAGSVAR